MALAIAALTLVLIVARPRGFGEPWTAASGAMVLLLTGVIGFHDVIAVIRSTADALLFLVGMMVLTWLAEQAGVFDRVAEEVAHRAAGSGPRLFIFIFVLAAVVTALLSLDVTILVLTPIVFALATRRGLDALPFMFACTFVANTGSLILPVSNLTNLLVYHQLGLGFARFAARMWLPNLTAVAINLGVFLWIFRERIPRHFDTTIDELPPVDWWFRATLLGLGATLVALFGLGLIHQPLAIASLTSSAFLNGVGIMTGRVRTADTVRAVSWSLFVFVIGMFLVVRGIEHAWLDHLDISTPHRRLPALLVAVAGTAIGSNLVNNVPMTLLALPIIARADGAAREGLAYGALVGANIGPTLTTYGSLATMLWLTLVRKRGMDVSTTEYMRVALLTAPPVLVGTTLALWLVLR